MDRVFGAYFHAFNKNEDLYRQPSLNGNYTLYETDYGNAGALHDSKLQNFYYLVVLLQFADYILLCFQATKP